MRDYIPDIHGDATRLANILSGLDYVREADCWRHPEGRRAVFLGDLIDNGRENRAVLSEVRAMIDNGQAFCLMGNHELNAILFHLPGRAWGGVQDGWMRARTASNTRQHQAFLDEFAGDDAGIGEAIGFFLSLPLLDEAAGLRAVHACWDERAVETVLARRPDARLRAEDLQEVALEESDFARAVVTLAKGPEIDLPPGISYADIYGKSRSAARLNWWAPETASYRGAVLSVPDRMTIPDLPLPPEAVRQVYPKDAPPVVFGHYKLTGRPDIHGNAICLDYPQTACALRESEAGLSLAILELEPESLEPV
ncbi:metallophosphoesterase [Defluviimonas salinarum]|uniref:Metallophosphoesterase n=1 Tax=Defluviimonas salinarum TaxID=2992147 RepID=A0ABT3J4A5_9RHOB|nr:metallophosphoesterase [Defluviimonas salinarum]MCW3782506.1 metallophosphoesterase [Defluviimonas salinarum]